GLVVMLVMSLFVGCGGEEAPAPDEGGADEGYTIGYSCNNFNDTFQTYIVDAAEAYAEANEEIALEVQDAQEDVVKQQDQVSTMIENGVDALVVVPVDTSAMEPITAAAKEAGIPLCYVNRNPFGEGELPEGVYYVGSQEIVAGRLQGEYLVDQMGEEGGVAILMGILSNEGALKRTEGNEEILSQYEGIEILAKETGNWQRDQGMSLTENWLTAYGDELNAILANNDEMALGAAQALQAAGRTDIIVMGVDAIPDAKVAVGEGTIAGTVLQDAVGQGEGALTVVHKVLMGEDVDPVTWIDFVLINPDNLADFQ
ncbi:MAG: substrate-binding domain-containing protein, partial [Clostridia bacterium]|nr:substrate-binding domain-containing protein [Clostridia bacterium]